MLGSHVVMVDACRGQEGPALPFLNPSEALTSDPTVKPKSRGAGSIALEQCINESACYETLYKCYVLSV